MKRILEKQHYHLTVLIGLSVFIWGIAKDDFTVGSIWGITTPQWLWLSVLAAALHQFSAVIFWRGELYYGWLSAWFGDQAFFTWAVGFMILLVARPLLIVGLAIANAGTLPIPPWMGYGLAGFCSIPVIYLFYSIGKFFGFQRALGIDHFFPEVYRKRPMVTKGIFHWFSNAMYTFGFLLLWIPGLVFLSRTALLAAAFNHVFIWAHYYFTELPDLKYIYSD